MPAEMTAHATSIRADCSLEGELRFCSLLAILIVLVGMSAAPAAAQHQAFAFDNVLFAAARTGSQCENQRAQAAVANAPRPFGGSSLSLVSHFVSPL